VKAYVVLQDGASASEDELRAFCTYKLVAYKVPTQFEFRSELPKNVIGKVLRRILRSEHEAAHDRMLSAGLTEDVAETAVIPALPTIAPIAGAPTDSVTSGRHAAVPVDEDTAEDLITALERLASLHTSGQLTDAEFREAKVRLLG
jgi:hypothetical protein